MDLSATRKILSVSVGSGFYCVGNMYNEFEKITTTEKTGDGVYVIWYQLWRDGQVVKEINSRFVVDVEYEPITSDPIPF